MRPSVWIAMVVMATVGGLMLWLFYSGDQTEIRQALKKDNLLSHKDAPIVVQKKHSPTNTKEENLEDDFNPYENEELSAQIQQVADIYQENIKYPNNSQPIYNPEDAREHKPFELNEVDLPFAADENEKSPIRLIAATDKFQYFNGDTIVARLQVVGAPKDVFVEVTANISGTNGDLPLEISFQPTDKTLTVFTASFDTKLAPAPLLTPEMLLKLRVTIDDRQLLTTVAFRYALASAQVIGVQQARPEGSNLVIPLQLNVFQSGYYFVSAILEEASTGRPLIQLQAEGRLQQGNGILALNAHIAALLRQGSEGPYRLRSIKTYRGADVGEDFDAPASSSQNRFSIPGFPFSAYENEEHIDQAAQQRLDFLRDIGSADEESIQEPREQ